MRVLLGGVTRQAASLRVANKGLVSLEFPRNRFDPASGAFRVRYAGDAQRVAMRERFDDEGRIVSTEHLRLHLVQRTGDVRVLDLRHDRNLDALGLDDQINTSRARRLGRVPASRRPRS